MLRIFSAVCFVVVMAWLSLASASARLPDRVPAAEQIELDEAQGARFVLAIQGIVKSYPKCTDKGCDWIHVDSGHLFNVLLYPDSMAPIVIKVRMEETVDHTQRTGVFAYWPPQRLYMAAFLDETLVDDSTPVQKFTPLTGDDLKDSVGPLINMIEQIAITSDD